MNASRQHFSEFGKNEERAGDGLYLAQERLPDLINPETGFPTAYAGHEGYYDAAKILETQPDISDESLQYLTKNKDVFRNAETRVANEEGLSYDDVAKQHYQMFGQEEGDRRGAEGLESLFTRPEQEPTTGETTGETIGETIGDIAGGIMSPNPEVEDDVSQIGKPIIAETDPELNTDAFHHLDATRQTEISEKARRDRTRQYQPGREPTDDKQRPLYAPADTMGDFDRRDVELFARSLGKANFGNQDERSITDFFEEKEDGSWDVKSNEYGIGFQSHDRKGNRNKTLVKLAGSLNKDGIPVSRALAKNIINARLSLIDESPGE